MKKINSSNNTKKSFLKDFFWYFLGSFLPLVIGFIKMPIFTRHFDKESFGYLGLVTITFSYLGMFLFSWIASCIWRYYHHYKDQKTLNRLYSNLFFLFLIALFLLIVISTFWYTTSTHYLTKQLIFYSFFQLIFNQLFLYYMVIIRLKRKANFYTIVHSLRSFVSLVMALVLAFVYKVDIVALVMSLVIVDAFIVSTLTLINPANIKLVFSTINKATLKELLNYGLAGLIINIGFLIITTSDRYIIAWLTNIENVGVYDQVYKISQLSILALVTIYFNTINPTLLNKLETDYTNSVKFIRMYMKAVFLYGLPIVIYLCLFSKEISNILLGKEFRSGYTIMPFVFFAAYLYGISNFYELRLKFSNKLKRLGIIVILIALLNVILTSVLVKFYGYKFAAVATLFVYLLLITIFHLYDKSILRTDRKQRVIIAKILVVLGVQVLIFIVVNKQFNMPLFYSVLLGLCYVVIYFVTFRREILAIKIPMDI